MSWTSHGLQVTNSHHSYIISVVTINDIGEGKIMPSTGQAKFKCSYTAIVMKPFKGEVVDGKVLNVNKMGFFAMVGPLQVFVSSHVSVASYCPPSPTPTTPIRDECKA